MNNKLVIAIILYKPCPETFARIIAAIGKGYKVYLFDNSADAKITAFITKYADNIRYFTSGKNAGIALALRLMCATAYFEGHDNLLYFDQDSIYNAETLDFISGYITESSVSKYENNIHDILSVTFRDKIVIRNSNHILNTISIGAYELNIVDLTISSGTLFSLYNLNKLGWHNDKYYIDGVDYDICLAAESGGLKVAEVFNTPHFDHESEQTNDYFKFLTIVFYGRKYPLYRIFDTIIAYTKLIMRSACMRSNKFHLLLFFLIIYVIKQIMIRVSIVTNVTEV